MHEKYYYSVQNKAPNFIYIKKQKSKTKNRKVKKHRKLVKKTKVIKNKKPKNKGTDLRTGTCFTARGTGRKTGTHIIADTQLQKFVDDRFLSIRESVGRVPPWADH